MDTGHEKKSKILLLLLGCFVFCIGGYFMIKEPDSFYRLIGYATMIFCSLGSIKLCFMLFSGKAYIEITPTYIQIDNFEKLLWTDIIGVRNFNMNGTTLGWIIDVTDTSKYKLTFSQKANLVVDSSPFYIALQTLSEKDREIIKRILKERIPQNDLN